MSNYYSKIMISYIRNKISNYISSLESSVNTPVSEPHRIRRMRLLSTMLEQEIELALKRFLDLLNTKNVDISTEPTITVNLERYIVNIAKSLKTEYMGMPDVVVLLRSMITHIISKHGFTIENSVVSITNKDDEITINIVAKVPVDIGTNTSDELIVDLINDANDVSVNPPTINERIEMMR